MAATAAPPAEPYCEKCRNSGWEPVTLDGVERLRRCVECPYLDWKRGGVRGLPADEVVSTLDNFVITDGNADALKHARFFKDGVHDGLYIHGGVGVGKTRLACSVLNMLNKAGTICRFMRVTQLLQQLQPGGDDDNKLWEAVTQVPVLCLDDVGANQGTDFARRMLQAIFDERTDRSRKTIWTSNLDLDDLAAFHKDQRLASRIVGSCKVVKIDGKDWRTVTRVRRQHARSAAASKRVEPPKQRSFTGERDE